jgi:hypothetical protein
MSRASVANIESGRQNVLLHHAYRLASALEFAKVSERAAAASLAKWQSFIGLWTVELTRQGKAARRALSTR